MGAPRLNRRKHERPGNMWDSQRIASDNALMNEYGLRSMKEIWKVQTEVSKLRKNVRSLLSAKQSGVESDIISRLIKTGVVQSGSGIDALLDLNERKLLDRRLESIVFRKGLAKSMLQARQLITHGFISVNGKRVRVPGYIVKVDEEMGISYYKPISIEAPAHAAAPQVPAQETQENESQSAEQPQNESGA